MIGVQLLLSFTSILFVYSAISPRNERLAFVSALVIALSPWHARSAWLVMSESFGVFLVSVAIWLISRFEQERMGIWQASLFGAVSVAACLTIPAVSVAVVAMWIVVAIRSVSRKRVIGGCIIGALVVMTPWQLHCFRATGHVVPTLLTPMARSYQGTARWLRTWVHGPREFGLGMWVFTWPNSAPQYDKIPDYAFSSDAEREEVEKLARAWRATGAIRANNSEEFQKLDALLAEIAQRRITKNPIRYYCAMPFHRAWHLWVDTPDVGLASQDTLGRLWPSGIRHQFDRYGFKRGCLRLFRAAWSGLVTVLHGAILFLIMIIAIESARSRNGIAIGILVGTLAYTAISAGSLYVEYRRNLPFELLLLFSAFYCMHRTGTRGLCNWLGRNGTGRP